MTGFPVRPARRLALIAVLAVAGPDLSAAADAARAGIARARVDVPAVSVAQIGPPRRLGPPVRLSPPDVQRPPSDAGPAVDPPAATGAAPDNRPASLTNRGVQTETLQTLDSASVGLIDSAQGGFGIALWRGSERALIEQLLPRLPARTPSLAARDLAVRLLSSRAEAPRGASNGSSLLAARVDRLLELGEIATATRLAGLIAAGQTDAQLAVTTVEALFLQNDNAGACQRVRGFVRRFDDAYWQRALAFCLTLSGERTRAVVVADILAERGKERAPHFFDLIEALNGGVEADIETMPNPSGLDLAMMRAANVRLPADVMSSDRPAVLRGVVASPNADLDLRLAAGERAFLYGAIDARTLNELYGAVPWKRDELAKPMTIAEARWGPRGRALLLRGAAASKSTTTKAEILRRAFELAREKGEYDIMVRASAPVMKSILPEPGLMWFAHDAVLALLSAGDVDRARIWLRLAENETAGNAQAREAATKLWAIGRFAAPETDPRAIEGAPFTTWLRSIKADKTDAGRRKAVVLLSLLEALGVETQPGRWAEFLADGASTMRSSGPDIAWARALDEASASRRIGETVLIALLGLANEKTGHPGPAEVRAAVAGLRRVGLESEARALALEAAVAYGL